MSSLLKTRRQAAFLFCLIAFSACTNTTSRTTLVNQTPTHSVAPGVIKPRTLAVQSVQPSATNTLTLIDLHNRWRQPLGLAPLNWSANLANSAQQWANTLQQQGCQLQHDPYSSDGENLASGTHLTAEGAAGLWANEAAYYDAPSGSCANGHECGHYTQMVWADSREIGCGVAYCQQFAVWVCRYNPPGNVLGYRPY